MKDNYILIKSEQQQLLEKVLFDLSNLYREVEYSKGIQLYRKKGQKDFFLILFTNNPDFERFCYFTNYFLFPFDHTNFKPKVRGFYKISDTNNKRPFNRGEWLMLFINENDKRGDNIYIVDEFNDTFIFDFGGEIKKFDSLVHKFKNFDIDLNDFNHIIDSFPAPVEQEQISKPWWKFW